MNFLLHIKLFECNFLYLDEKMQELHIRKQRREHAMMSQSFRRPVPKFGERHKCSVCEKSFSSLYSVKRHKQMFHSDKRANFCGECGKTFCNTYSLNRHMLSHSSARPFICSICGKTYKYKHDLKNHSITHATEMGLPFHCM